MGGDAMGTNCRFPHAVVAAVERIRRASMPYSGNHRYTIKGLTAPAAQTMGSGLYMVIDLNSCDYDFPVTYMGSAPAKWGDEYVLWECLRLLFCRSNQHDVGGGFF